MKIHRILFLIFLCLSYLSGYSQDTVSVRKILLNDSIIEITYKIKNEYNGIEEKKTRLYIPKFDVNKINKNDVSLLIKKSAYSMYIIYKGKKIRRLKVVFGAAGITKDKMVEGDKCTPIGEFLIKDIRPNGEWNMFMELDYPNEESKRKFDYRKSLGMIAINARIGGSIGIHGVAQGRDAMIDQKYNWTDGCISLKNADLIFLSKIVQIGTKVKIEY